MRSSRLAAKTKETKRDSKGQSEKDCAVSVADHGDSSLPLPPAQVKLFLRQANLTKLIENYQPSQLLQEKRSPKRSNKTYRLRKLDIVCGRGNVINKLPGNVLMRLAIAGNQKAYLRLDRGTKSLAAAAMIRFFENWKIRFVEPENPHDLSLQGRFLLAPYTRVHEKVMMALRQKITRKPGGNTAKGGAKKSASKICAAAHKSVKRTKQTKTLRSPSRSSVIVEPTKAPRSRRLASRSRASKANTDVSSSTSLENDDAARRSWTISSSEKSITAAPVELQGSFVRPVPAPVLSLASFLRNHLQMS